MKMSSDEDLRRWTEDWQAEKSAPADPRAVVDFVRRRTRLHLLWSAFDVVFAVCALAFLVHRATTHPDPAEKVAMGSLALIVGAWLLFAIWTWRGATVVSAMSTSGFVAWAAERSRRLERMVRAGWILLVLELLVFVPWMWHRLYGGDRPPSPSAERFGWGFLVCMVAWAVVFLVWLRRWSRRESHVMSELRRELRDNGG